MPGIMTRQFVKGLHYKTVYKILISLSGKSAYGVGRDHEGMQQKLVQLLLNKHIKVYKLSAIHYSKILMEQNNVLITNARTIDRVTHRSAENLLDKQLKLNLELCLILSARWKEKIRMDDQFWALAWYSRLTVVSGGALNTIVDSIVGLVKLGAVVIEGIYDASLYQLKIIGQLSQGEFAQVQRELTKLGVDAASDIDALQQHIKDGYEIIEPLLEDDKSRKILMDFLSGYVDSVPYVEKGAFAVSIPLEVLIALASMGAGTVVTASGSIRRLGQFSGHALELILDLSRTIKRFKQRIMVDAESPHRISSAIPAQPAITSPGTSGNMNVKGILTNKINMRSPTDLMGIEAASPKLISAISRKRDVVIAKPGSEELRMLDYFEAEASVGGINSTHILLRENPSRAAILEEFLHGTQTRLGITDRLGTTGLGSAETHVKDFMIRHQKMLGLSDEDVQILQILKDEGL